MELLLIVLIVIAVLITYRREYMTNKDVSSIMQHYGDDDEGKRKHDKPASAPIFGPTAPKPRDPPGGGGGGEDARMEENILRFMDPTFQWFLE